MLFFKRVFCSVNALSAESVQHKRIDRIYCCATCRAAFFFKSDLEDHQQMYPEYSHGGYHAFT